MPKSFNLNDAAHLDAARTFGVVTRYDYEPISGSLPNAIDMASPPGFVPHSLGFYRVDLFVSLKRRGDGRISRYSDPDVRGVYRVRHDFVHSIRCVQIDHRDKDRFALAYTFTTSTLPA